MKQHSTSELIRNEIMTRTQLLRRLIDPKRDIDKEAGYPDQLTIDDYRVIYDREGIGTRVVDIFPEESWKTDPEVLEKQDDTFTPWEQAWKDLEEEFNIYAELQRADCMSGIGSFGVVLIGIDDGLALDQPAKGVAEREDKRVKVTTDIRQAPRTPPAALVDDPAEAIPVEAPQPAAPTRKLIYLRPFDESVVKISAFETDAASPRYGQPTLYEIRAGEDAVTGNKPKSQSPDNATLRVHWSRILHLADKRGNSLVFATPRMQDVFNRTYDIRKLCGGAGEMFWRGGYPGLSLEMLPGVAGLAELTDTDKKNLRKEIEAYQQGQQRYLALANMKANSLAPNVADPTAHFLMFIQSICVSKGIPYRIFMGSEAAQLASEQDKKAWNDRMTTRRKKYITPRILRPFVKRLMAMGVLSWLDKIIYQWDDLNAPSDQQKADIGAKRTTALKDYVAGQVDTLIPPLEYLTRVLGYDTDTAEGMIEQANLGADGTLATREDDQLAMDEEAAKQAQIDGARSHQVAVGGLKIKAKQAAARPAARPPARR